MASSTDISAGDDGTATQYNNLRLDAITRERVYVFEIIGTLTAGIEQGGRYIIPANATVTKIKHIITSGTSATFKIQKDTTDVDANIVATTTVTEETTITSAALTENQILTLDITSVSGTPEDLLVQVTTTETI